MKVDVHRPFKKRKITFGLLKQLPLQRQQTTAEAEKIEVAPVKETYRACNAKESHQKVLLLFFFLTDEYTRIWMLLRPNTFFIQNGQPVKLQGTRDIRRLIR